MTEENTIADFSLRKIEQILPADRVSEINPSLITLENDVPSKNNVEKNQVDRNTLKSISPKPGMSLSDRNKTGKIFPIFTLSNSSSISNQTQGHDLPIHNNFLPESNSQDISGNQNKIPSFCSGESHSISTTMNNIQEIQKADLVSDCFSSHRRKRGKKCIKTVKQVTDNQISKCHMTIEKQSTKKILLSRETFNDSKNATSSNVVSEHVNNSVSDVKFSKIISPKDTNTSAVKTSFKLFPLFSKISPTQDLKQKDCPIEEEASRITMKNSSQESLTNKRRKCKVKISESPSVISKKAQKPKSRIGSKNAKFISRKTISSVKKISKKQRQINKNKSVVCSEFEEIRIKSTPEKNAKQIQQSTEDNVFEENNTPKALPLTKQRRSRKYRRRNKWLKNNSEISDDMDNIKSSANQVDFYDETINKSTLKIENSVEYETECKTNNFKIVDNNADAATSVISNNIGSSKAQKLFSIFSHSSSDNKVKEDKETNVEENTSNECAVGKSLIKNMQNNLDVMLSGKKDEKLLKEVISSDSSNINFIQGNMLMNKINKNFPNCNMSGKISSEINKRKLDLNMLKNVSSIKTSHSIPMKKKKKAFKNTSTKRIRQKKKIISKHKQVDDSLVEEEIAVDISEKNMEILHATQSSAHEVKDEIVEISLTARKYDGNCREKKDSTENFHGGNMELSENGSKFSSKIVIDATGIKIKDGVSFQTDCIYDNSFRSKKSGMQFSENDVNLNNASRNKPLLFSLFSKSCRGREVNQNSNLPQRERSSENIIILEKTKTEEKQKKLEMKQPGMLKETFSEQGISIDYNKNLKTENMPTKNNNELHVQETVSCKKVQVQKIQETVSADILSKVQEVMQNKRLQKINACKDPAGISANNILKTKRTAKKKHLLNVDNSSNDSVNGKFFEITSQNSTSKVEQFYKYGNIFQKNNSGNIAVAVKRKKRRKCRKGKRQKTNNEIFDRILDGEKQTITDDELSGDVIDASELETKCKISDNDFMNAYDSVTALPENMISANTDSSKPVKLFPLFAKASPNKHVKHEDNLLMEELSNSDCGIEKLASTPKLSIKFSDQLRDSSSENVKFKEKQEIKISKITISSEILGIVPKAVESKRNRKTAKCEDNANISEYNILTSKRTTRKMQLINIDNSGDEECMSQKSTNRNYSANSDINKQSAVVIHNNDSTDEEIIIENVCRDDKIESQQTENFQNVIKKINVEKASSDKCKVKKVLSTEEENFAPFPSFTHCNFSYKEFNSGIFCSTSNEILYEDIKKPYWSHIVGLTDVKSINNEIKRENEEICSTSLIHERLNDNVCEKKVYGRTQDEMLWTDYLNDLKEDFNKFTLDEIRTWLLQWKSKFKKPCVDESSIDSFSSNSSDSTDGVSNSIIIAGMPGTGKTSIVLSLANELGFKVLEVNSSTCRNGRSISNQLKEALESYHVENIRIENANSETALTDDILISSSCSIQKGSCKGILNSSNDVFNEEQNSKGKVYLSGRKLIKSKKVYLSDKGQKTSPQKEPGRNIKTFFKCVNKDEKCNSSNFKVMQQNVDKDESATHKGSSKKRKIVKEFSHDKNSELDHTKKEIKQEMSSCKISSLTIILFDDIDVVFEEDEGLWNTIKGFLKISRKPVIFTVSRNLAFVKANLGEDIQVLTLKPASQDIAVEKVKYQCVKHNRGNAAIDLKLLTSHNANDLRRSLLDAQFWTQEKEVSCSYKGSCSCMLNTSEVPLYKRVHANSFFLGSLNFLAWDLKQLLLNNTPAHSMDIISEYLKMGYDVLHSNIFSVMNVLDNLKTELLWQNIRNSDIEIVNSASESNMWDEACKLFELKKRALLKGSCSKDLFAFSSLLEDFSFADSLKGQFYTNFHWLSIPERVKKWTDGLPICSESNFHSYGDVLADIIALMNIYKIREMCSNYPETYHAPTGKSVQLFLDQPLKCDYIFNNKTEQQLQCISTALPSLHFLTKTNLNMDYLSTLKIMCQSEYSKQMSNCKRSRRFLHYFDSISLALDKFHTKFILDS
ncbi:uncharacterized protein LOC118193515 [Stegodyphus dumicola]|uniref:uncharacterized protein LOC118193515 n=1 Tax=Stegodyphus dumicola TaxID=202533 RepID=UPI0015AC2A55|nr:uncharacterized protein LOC118193515 [Stegodyphus dumicola]